MWFMTSWKGLLQSLDNYKDAFGRLWTSRNFSNHSGSQQGSGKRYSSVIYEKVVF